MELTMSEIKEDIRDFKDRISLANKKLAELPVGPLPLWEHKKREKQTRDLQDEIRHYEQIIRYAQQALDEEKGEA